MDHSWGQPSKTGNNSASLSNNMGQNTRWLLNIRPFLRIVLSMRKFHLSLALVVSLAVASPAFAADCYADYKAKQDSPLRLHYGVLEIRNGCNSGSAKQEAAQRLRANGWTLLNVLSVFGPEGLQQRKNSAGQFYLRF